MRNIPGFDIDILEYHNLPSRFSGSFHRTNYEEVCTGETTKSGAWCLKPSRPPKKVSLKHSSYELPDGHCRADRGILRFLMIIMMSGQTLLDLGAGVGQYGLELLDRNASWRSQYMAFDGAVNVESFTNGFVKNANLGIAQDFPVADWVMSLEVGEHILHSLEDEYVQNIHMSNRRGILLSWGVLHQAGKSHINNHSPDYILKRFSSLGYKYDNETTHLLRTNAVLSWLRRSVYVFRR